MSIRGLIQHKLWSSEAGLIHYKKSIEFIGKYIWLCLVPKNFFSNTSHRIFGHMHGVLNIDKLKKTNCTVRGEIARRIFWA